MIQKQLYQVPQTNSSKGKPRNNKVNRYIQKIKKENHQVKFTNGKGRLLPNLAHLYETQQIEVQYYNPLIGVSFSEKIPENMRGLFPFMLGESIGLAKSALVESDARSKEINLLPQAKIQSIGFKQKTPILILSSFLICLLPLPFIWKSWVSIINIRYKRIKLIFKRENCRPNCPFSRET